MAWFTRSSRFIILVTILAVALMLGFVTHVSGQVQAPSSSASLNSKLENAFRPPRGTSSPVNTASGGTRQGKDEELGRCIESNRPVVALVPDSGIGETAAEYPTVFWYMPQTAARALEFVLRDENVNDLYRVKYLLPKSRKGVVSTPGIMSLALPSFASLSPLKTGQEYYWQLALICNPTNRLKDIIVEGWIKRVDPDQTLALRVQQATPQERVALYAGDRLWNETLTSLVELRRDRPNDKDVAEAWKTLLDSVGLEAISSEWVK